MNFLSASAITAYCKQNQVSLPECALKAESDITGKSEAEIKFYLRDVIDVMFEAIDSGLDPNNPYKAKIIKEDAIKLNKRSLSHDPLCGHVISKAAQYAMSTMKVNAGMGRIVASPTAGSCGVLPGVLKTLNDYHAYSEDALVNALLVANVIGSLVARNATISGAEGGCQAEVGTASAMAAAAAVYLDGGNEDEIFNSAAMAFKNVLGLVCDPIAGLVESPCAKRNAMGATNALLCAEMARAGIQSIIPFDEVVEAMYRIGRAMPAALRETSLGGLAVTPTAIQISTSLFDET